MVKPELKPTTVRFVAALPQPTKGPTACELVAEYRKLEAEVPVPRRAPGVLEAAGRDAPIYLRGNHRTPGPIVPRGFLEALGGVLVVTTPNAAGLFNSIIRTENRPARPYSAGGKATGSASGAGATTASVFSRSSRIS